MAGVRLSVLCSAPKKFPSPRSRKVDVALRCGAAYAVSVSVVLVLDSSSVSTTEALKDKMVKD
jgi:hypothetical protein